MLCRRRRQRNNIKRTLCEFLVFVVLNLRCVESQNSSITQPTSTSHVQGAASAYLESQQMLLFTFAFITYLMILTVRSIQGHLYVSSYQAAVNWNVT